MITMCTGMPGDGKSLFAVCRIVKALVESEKFVVSSIKFLLPRLREFVAPLHEAYSKKHGLDRPAFDLDARFRLISDAEAFEFYRYRSGGLVLPSSPDYLLRNGGDEDRAGKRLTKQDHDAAMLAGFALMKADPAYMVPVEYFIDEVHEIFPSREWANGGRGVLFYASKHRHLHDEIFLITQQIDQVEKQLRNLVSETVVIRNQSRRNVGLFRSRPGFALKYFYGIPSPNGKPFSEERFEMDVSGPASCYRTTGALGVHSAPEAIKNKGRLPHWMLYLAGAGVVGCLCLAFVALPALGGFGAKKLIGGAGAVAVKSVGSATGGPVAAAGGATAGRTEAVSVTTRSVSEGRSSASTGPRAEVTGVLVGRGRVIVTLSDGRTFTEQDSELQKLGRSFVFVDGEKLFYRLPGAGRAAQATTSSPTTIANTGGPATTVAPGLVPVGGSFEVPTAQTVVAESPRAVSAYPAPVASQQVSSARQIPVQRPRADGALSRPMTIGESVFGPQKR